MRPKGRIDPPEPTGSLSPRVTPYALPKSSTRSTKWRTAIEGECKMPHSMKLYSHALAPNPRRVRIFAAEKGIELMLADVDILAGQSRTPEFLAKNSSG